MDPRKRARILDKVRQGRATRIERLILKQEGLCFYCWTDLDRDVTKEHLWAKADGGGSEPVNLRAAHMLCNGVVGSLPVDVKLELHEIGRDKGPEAFWIKAKEYQKRYGTEKNAYRRNKGGIVAEHQRLANARVKTPDSHELTATEAGVELTRMEAAQEPLNKYQRGEAVHHEVERRKETGLPVQMGLIGWFRLMESRGWCARPAYAPSSDTSLEAA